MVKRTLIFIMLALFLLAIGASAESSKIKKHEKGDFAPDEVIVKLKDKRETSTIYSDQILSGRNIIKADKNEFRERGLDRIHLLKVKDVQAAIDELNNNPDVEYVEPNYVVTVDKVPNDPNFAQLYGLDNTGQNGGKADADIDAPEAWDIQTGDGKAVVAVIDTGIDYNHEDLAQNVWHNSKEIPNNGIDDDNNGFVDDYTGWNFVSHNNNPLDDNGHGTHVSGTIGAVGNNGIGVTGVDWNVKIMPLKAFDSSGSAYISDIISAIQYATIMHVDIMSNSWSGASGNDQALKDAIGAANNAGILFVAAASNYGQDNDINPAYPASYNFTNIISVAATDRYDNLAYFSNYGANSVDLGAPGVYILSTYPVSICNCSGYVHLDGTSMATPHVSGAAALIKSQYPELSHLQIKDKILNSVDRIPSLEAKTFTGGRLNVFKALQNNSNMSPPLQVIYSNNFESGTNGWLANGLWHLESFKSYSPTTSWTYNTASPSYNYETGGVNSGGLMSPPIDLTNKRVAFLRFNDFYETENSGTTYDQRWVLISAGAAGNDSFQLSGDRINVWNHKEIDLTKYAGNVITIQYFFNTVDNLINNFWGWSIDDVTILADFTPVNNPPVANAGQDITADDLNGDGFESFALSGTGFDSDGSVVSYEWKEGSSILGTAPLLTHTFSVGTHTLNFTVTDNGGLKGSDTAIVKVNPKPATQPKQIFFDDFQGSGFTKFKESNEYDWRIASPAEKNILGYPGSNLVAHADNCTTSVGCILTFKNALNLSGYKNATLSFWRYVDNELTSGDILKLEMYNGSKWKAVANWSNGAGNDDTWHKETLDLSKFLTARFNVRFTSKESLPTKVTEIDDASITGIPK